MKYYTLSDFAVALFIIIVSLATILIPTILFAKWGYKQSGIKGMLLAIAMACTGWYMLSLILL